MYLWIVLFILIYGLAIFSFLCSLFPFNYIFISLLCFPSFLPSFGCSFCSYFCKAHSIDSVYEMCYINKLLLPIDNASFLSVWYFFYQMFCKSLWTTVSSCCHHVIQNSQVLPSMLTQNKIYYIQLTFLQPYVNQHHLHRLALYL